MATNNTQKITKLLAKHRSGAVLLAGWLEKQGFSRELQHSYVRSGWLEPLGSGAFRRAGDDVSWAGAVASLQQQASAAIYPGGLTALALHGLAHYVRLDSETVYLFSPPKTTLPTWFRRWDWGVTLSHQKTSQMPVELGLQTFSQNPHGLKLSSPERATLECLLLTPDPIDLSEVRDLFPALAGLRPKVLQPLLEQCGSVKAKRLLLYLADLTGLAWRKRLDDSRIDLGRGHRRLVEGGDYISEYQLTVPQGLGTL